MCPVYSVHITCSSEKDPSGEKVPSKKAIKKQQKEEEKARRKAEVAARLVRDCGKGERVEKEEKGIYAMCCLPPLQESEAATRQADVRTACYRARNHAQCSYGVFPQQTVLIRGLL